MVDDPVRQRGPNTGFMIKPSAIVPLLEGRKCIIMSGSVDQSVAKGFSNMGLSFPGEILRTF